VPKVPKKSDFFAKSDFSNRAQGTQEIRFFCKIGFLKPCAQTCPRNVPKKSGAQVFGKIGFLNPCPSCPRNLLEKSDFSNRAQVAQEIFWKNRISQTVPKVPKKSFGKIGFLKLCPRCPRNPIFWKNRISQTVCPNVPKKCAQEIRCPRNPIFWKIFCLKNRNYTANSFRYLEISAFVY
jgi:hypothetical protein